MAYFTPTLLSEYQKLKQQESLLALKASQAMQLPLQQFSQKDLLPDPYQDMSSLMLAAGAMNNRMGYQQLAPQRTEQSLISQLMLQNELLQQQVRTLTAEKAQLAKSLEQVEKKLEEANNTQPVVAPEVSSKKKRFRRVAKDILRDFHCPVETCGKAYGSEGSLHQHIRLKHAEFDLSKWSASVEATEQRNRRSEISIKSENSLDGENTHSASEGPAKSKECAWVLSRASLHFHWDCKIWPVESQT